MHVFILITNIFQGENLGINICKEVIIIEFRGHYKTKQNKTKQKSSQEITVKDQRASQVSPAKQLEEISQLSF